MKLDHFWQNKSYLGETFTWKGAVYLQLWSCCSPFWSHLQPVFVSEFVFVHPYDFLKGNILPAPCAISLPQDILCEEPGDTQKHYHACALFSYQINFFRWPGTCGCWPVCLFGVFAETILCQPSLGSILHSWAKFSLVIIIHLCSIFIESGGCNRHSNFTWKLPKISWIISAVKLYERLLTMAIIWYEILTMSSYPYLMAVNVRTENKGTAVVTADKEEISGISWKCIS